MRSIAIALVLLWSAAAGAVPKSVNFTGRLTTSAGPVNGAVNITLKLFADATGGTDLWNEVHNNVGADNGLVFLDIGSSTTLDDTVLDGRRLFLEITVGGETLSPRLAFNSVPYAVRTDAAATADLLGGTIGPGDVVTTVTGAAGLTATRTRNAVSVGLTTTNCANGQVFQFNGGTFGCANGTSFTGTAPISVNGTTISLSATGVTGCGNGAVLKSNGTTFTCQADNNTTYTGTLPVKVDASTSTISLSATGVTGCGNGAVLKSNGSTFTCQPDDNTILTGTAPISVGNGTVSLVATGVTGCGNGAVLKSNGTTFTCQNDVGITGAASPLVVTGGTTVSLPTTCGANQVLRWNGSAWACSPTFAAASCAWSVATPSGSAVNLLAACGSRRPISGGCLAGAGAVTETRPASITTNGDAVTAATGWFCAFNSSSAGHFAFALCCDAI